MKAFAVCALMLVSTFAADVATAADDSDRPDGVEASHWLPISAGFGFVVMAKNDGPLGGPGGSKQVLLADPERVSADLMPPKKGYFVIKTKTGWQRLVVSDPAELGG
jgi:hypothetical protein